MVVSILPHAELGRNDHRESALHFTIHLGVITEIHLFEGLQRTGQSYCIIFRVIILWQQLKLVLVKLALL